MENHYRNQKVIRADWLTAIPIELVVVEPQINSQEQHGSLVT